jgi:predicted MFS family arabinose efflux permease
MGSNQDNSTSVGGWAVVIAYALLCAATQLLWLTYAAITTESARHYGVSVSAIGWLAEIFPLLYVALAVPAGILLDRWFRRSLATGTLLVAAGGLLRLGGGTFAWAMSGQIVVAVAQPLVLSAVSKLAGEYLPANERPNGIAVASAGSFVGMLLALLLGPTLGGHGAISRLLVSEALIAVVATLGLLVALRRPGLPGTERARIAGSATRALWRMGPMRTLYGLAFLGFGIFVAIATWLQTLLHPAGVSEATSGAILVVMIVAGTVGCGALAPVIMRRARERSFLAATIIIGAGGCAVLAAAPWLAVRGLAVIAIGIFVLSALPIILTLSEQLAGPLAGTAGATIWMAGNLGGLVVALVVQLLVHHPTAAFLAMGATALLGMPLLLRFKVQGGAIASAQAAQS